MFVEHLETPIGAFSIEANDQAIVEIHFIDKILTQSAGNKITKLCSQQLKEYFLGQRQKFELPLKQTGTNFQLAVWQELINIPYGETRTYSNVAETIGKPRAQRAVGSANYRNPLPIVIPCHRVVSKKDGLAGYALGLEKKEWLLNHEQTHR